MKKVSPKTTGKGNNAGNSREYVNKILQELLLRWQKNLFLAKIPENR